MDKDTIPKHIAFIMDGNGRWAKEHGLPRSAGHREGAERVRDIVEAASELGVKVVTFFAFSTENWSRPKSEIEILMRYLEHYLDREIKQLHKNNVRFLVIGGGDPLPKYLQKRIRQAEELTRDNKKLTLALALNYGSRQEIVEAAKRFAVDVSIGKLKPEELDTKRFSRYLYTAGLLDPDLLVRTSGEMRISNFLLWQLSYAELYFPDKYWPDFRRADLVEAIEEYQRRERRFGRVNVHKEAL